MSERLRVGVLGPLLLRRGETEVSAGPPQRRALLSALVLRRGTPASVRELADELWGEEAPPSAVAVIRSYVHQLRRTLGSDPAAGVAIQSSSGGYFAEIAAGVLDLQVFERLVADADRARAAGDRVAAADRLREALGLWRGPALADVAGPGADRIVARWPSGSCRRSPHVSHSIWSWTATTQWWRNCTPWSSPIR